MVVWVLADVWGAGLFGRAMVGIGVTAAMVVLVLATQIQVGYWRDSSTLFSHALGITERNYLAHYKLGLALAEKGSVTAARDHYREALMIKPSFVEAHNSVGHLLMIQGNDSEAVAHFEAAIHIRPDFAPALKNLGDLRLRRGMVEGALTLYEKALSYEDQDSELFNNYGVALATMERTDEAAEQIRKAVDLDPNYGEAKENLRKILNSRSRP